MAFHRQCFGGIDQYVRERPKASVTQFMHNSVTLAALIVVGIPLGMVML